MALVDTGGATGSTAGLVALVMFCAAYLAVVLEERLHLRKSKPVILGAGAIWVCVSMSGVAGDHLHESVNHHLVGFTEVFLFLLAAMAYINAIAERRVFLRLNAWLVSSGFGLRAVFWATGAMAFVLSPLADNLTTALVLGAVVITVGRRTEGFVPLACTNVVVAANAGGAFSPFGDITTLMVWQAGKVSTLEFVDLLAPSLVNWLIPAVLMSFAVPRQPAASHGETVTMRRDWWVVVLLFAATIATAVSFHGLLGLPPFLGMTTGLSYLLVYGWLHKLHRRRNGSEAVDVFGHVAAVEWDTLLFFFGVIMCVGGLDELGWLGVASDLSYEALGTFWANVNVGVLSALVDNVPVMFGVLAIDPVMTTDEWLLVTLTAGVGGSLLSIGSAAGVALMGLAHGRYTFLAHLRWSWAIALGYAGSIGMHVAIQGA